MSIKRNLIYTSAEKVDITDGLDDEQLTQLKALSEEDEMKDTHTLKEFMDKTEQWRIDNYHHL